MRSLNTESNSRNFVLKLNLLEAAFFCYLVAYGFYGSVSPPPENQSIWVVVALNCCLLIPLFVYRNIDEFTKKVYEVSIPITPTEVITCCLISLPLILVSFTKLNYSLYADELSYAGSADGHSILISGMLVKQFPEIGKIPFKILVQVGNLGSLTLLYCLWGSLKKINKPLNFIFVILFFILFRIIFILKGGNGNPHPPLALTPVLLSTTIFGVNEFGIKISYFIAYLLYCYFVFFVILKRTGKYDLAIGGALAISTIPIALDMATVIEHALFSYIFISTILIYLLSNKHVNYPIIFLWVVIGSFFRQSILLFFIPLTILYLFDRYSTDIKELAPTILKLLAPGLLFLPIALNSLIRGTPSTSPMSDFLKITPLQNAICSGFLLNHTRSVFQVQLLILFLGFFIPTSIKNFWEKLVYVFYFLLLLLLYFSISPGLWSNPKYQVEYIAPFIAASIAQLACAKLNGFLKPIPAIFIYLVLTLNILGILKVYGMGVEKDHVSINYPYKEAYKRIGEFNLRSDTFSVGITYGSLPEIINSYSGKEWLESTRKYKLVKNLNVDSSPHKKAVAITQLDNTNTLLIQGDHEIEKIIPELAQQGWKELALIQPHQQSQKIYIYMRENKP